MSNEKIQKPIFVFNLRRSARQAKFSNKTNKKSADNLSAL